MVPIGIETECHPRETSEEKGRIMASWQPRKIEEKFGRKLYLSDIKFVYVPNVSMDIIRSVGRRR